MSSRASWNNWRNASILFALCMVGLVVADRLGAWNFLESALGGFFLVAIVGLAVAWVCCVLGVANLVLGALSGLGRLGFQDR